MGQPAHRKPADKNEQKVKKVDFEIAGNPNPRANENIRVRTEDPEKEEIDTDNIGSEITDEEAG